MAIMQKGYPHVSYMDRHVYKKKWFLLYIIYIMEKIGHYRIYDTADLNTFRQIPGYTTYYINKLGVLYNVTFDTYIQFDMGANVVLHTSETFNISHLINIAFSGQLY